MALQKLQMCQPSHKKQFEYCCLKSSKVFCSKCWNQTQHYRTCGSSRCGKYQTLAHLVINRALQLKNSYYLQKMAPTYDKYEFSRIRFIQLNYQITQSLRGWVQQKIPLFAWAMINQMLHSKYSQQQKINCDKYDGMCTQMLKAIRDLDVSKKSEYLQLIVSNYYTINHQIDGNMNSLKSNPNEINKNPSPKLQKIDQVYQHCRKNIGQLLVSAKAGFKNVMDAEVARLLKNYDASITFTGVTFHKMADSVPVFKKKESFQHMNLNTELFSKVNNEQSDLYNGFNLSVPQLQSCPQQILQISKSFIKQKIYNMHSSIQTFKSSFPYKYAYVMATTLEPDQQFEELTLQLQKACIKAAQPKSLHPFFNSTKIAIMGPETIIIKFMNHPDFSYIMKIYNWKKQREPYYQKLKDIIIGLKELKESKYNQIIKIQFTSQISPTSLAYINFRLVYDQLFIINNQEMVYQGEKVTSARGMQLFQQVMEKWKSFARVQLNFNVPSNQMISLFV